MVSPLVRRSSRWLVGPLLAAVLLWLTFRTVDLRSVMSKLETVHILGWLAAAVLILAQVPLRVWRWKQLIEPIKTGVETRGLIEAVILGNAVNIVVPGRLGELLRPVLLAGRENLPPLACVGTVFADRWLDTIAVCLLFVGGMIGLRLDGLRLEGLGDVTHAVVVVLVVSGGLIFAGLAAFFRGRRCESPVGQTKILQRLCQGIVTFSRGIEAFTIRKHWMPLAWQSVLIWISIGLGQWLGLLACGIEIPVFGIFVLLPILVVGVALPTPGGVGGYHLGMTVALTHFFGISTAEAATASLVVHLAGVVPTLLLAGAFLVSGSSTLRDVSAGLRLAKSLREANGNECTRVGQECE